MHDHAPNDVTASTSLLVWGGAPGDCDDYDFDVPRCTSGEEPDPDEYAA
jgi:hypothetical protein